ncbi:MAG TPA: hypothetical protein VE914_02935 [Candidatus Angelobacter sp.]|nr:hypothetical protein [Candidatus Angelobacter sp.]
MRAMMSMIVAVGVLAVGLALSGCTNRALSLMDTDPFDGNVHPHLVLKDGQVQYQDGHYN